MSCPFCATTLRDVPAPIAFAGLLLGLSLMGCGDDTTNNEEGAGSATESGTVSASGEESGSSGESGTLSTTENMETAEASDYGGPEATSEVEESGPPPESSSEDTGSEDTASEDTTGAESGSSDSTGTDTGEATTDESAGEGSDYGGAPPQTPH